MKEMTLAALGVIASFFLLTLLVAIGFAVPAVIFYAGLPIIGVTVTFAEAMTVSILIYVVGVLFRGVMFERKNTKEDE
ncbi:hypothetical protein [Cytobacillus gottheilii]|uniref:Uncharacterized protein n=1 Tax=Cytobacillus gottheilii TaxID=859144 RepID=A0ABX8FFZ8_9BACI|nr:hypothetical protein [Cytobacillus gottheilii]QVY62958.1 hypothetical protein J1899_07915 [Cytobacillus gottheilii]